MNELTSNLVEVYWSGVVQRLDAEVAVLNRLVPHRGEQGRANELALFQLIENLLPRNLGVGTGIIIDSDGHSSPQIDIVIYDQASQPQILAQTTQLLFPIETVVLTIEVKTTLDTDEIEKCAKAKSEIKSLTISDDGNRPPYFLMAYKSALLPRTLYQKYSEISEDNQPDSICVLDSSIIGGFHPFFTGKTATQNNFQLAHTPLHERDGSGNRESMTWQHATPEERGQKKVIRDGRTYPVTAISAQDKRRLICEPGRALLLFCQAMLQVLADQGLAKKPFLPRYLSGTAAEIELFRADG